MSDVYIGRTLMILAFFAHMCCCTLWFILIFLAMLQSTVDCCIINYTAVIILHGITLMYDYSAMHNIFC